MIECGCEAVPKKTPVEATNPLRVCVELKRELEAKEDQVGQCVRDHG